MLTGKSSSYKATTAATLKQTMASCLKSMPYHVMKGTSWYCGVVVTTSAQLHSTKAALRFCVGSNPTFSTSEIGDGENLWQWSRLEIKLNVFRQSTIPQKQFIIIDSSRKQWSCMNTNLLNQSEGLKSYIEKLWEKLKTPFLWDLKLEDWAENENWLLVFNIFNRKGTFTEGETWDKANVFRLFHGSQSQYYHCAGGKHILEICSLFLR